MKLVVIKSIICFSRCMVCPFTSVKRSYIFAAKNIMYFYFFPRHVIKKNLTRIICYIGCIIFNGVVDFDIFRNTFTYCMRRCELSETHNTRAQLPFILKRNNKVSR